MVLGLEPIRKPPAGYERLQAPLAAWRCIAVSRRGRATVAEIQEEILHDRKVAYTTIMTVMKKLAKKGYLSFERDGMAYVYEPARPAGEVKHSLLAGILKQVFRGSPVDLVESQRISPRDD